MPLDSGEAISEFDAWTAALRGRLVGFWLPAPEQAFRIVAATSPTQFDIEAAGLAATFEDGPELHLWFTKADEAPVAVKVSSVADLGEGLERVREWFIGSASDLTFHHPHRTSPLYGHGGPGASIARTG